MLELTEQGLTILKTSAEDPIPASINATCRDQQRNGINNLIPFLC